MATNNTFKLKLGLDNVVEFFSSCGLPIFQPSEGNKEGDLTLLSSSGEKRNANMPPPTKTRQIVPKRTYRQRKLDWLLCTFVQSLDVAQIPKEYAWDRTSKTLYRIANQTAGFEIIFEMTMIWCAHDLDWDAPAHLIPDDTPCGWKYQVLIAMNDLEGPRLVMPTNFYLGTGHNAQGNLEINEEWGLWNEYVTLEWDAVVRAVQSKMLFWKRRFQADVEDREKQDQEWAEWEKCKQADSQQ